MTSPEYIVPVRGALSQRLHAAAVVVLPMVAAFVALVQVVRGEVQGWHVVLALVLYFITFAGITVGYHRLLAHRAFQTVPVVKMLLLVAGSAAAQGPPIYWVANHRRHHRFSDQPGDPHSPVWIGQRKARNRWEAFWHSHLGWIFDGHASNTVAYCKDLFQDRVVTWVNRRYHLWLLLGLFTPVCVGFLITGSTGGAWDGLIWGGGVRAFLSYHFASSVNSVTHMFGQRPFATREKSANNAWFALPTLGEAWHNNHHAYASSAFFGFHWWQVDIGAYLIRVLEISRLASNVVRPDQQVLGRLQADAGD